MAPWSTTLLVLTLYSDGIDPIFPCILFILRIIPCHISLLKGSWPPIPILWWWWWWCFLKSTLQVFSTPGVSYNFTKFLHYLSGDSIRSHRLRAWFCKTAFHPFRCQSWASDQLTIDLRFPTISSLCSTNMLEWFIELRETFYLLHPSIYYKRKWIRNSLMEETYMDRHGERACSFQALSRCTTFPNPSTWKLF